MRLRVATGWAVTVLLATVGCGQTSGTMDTGSGAGTGGGGGEPPVMGLDFVQSGSRLVALGYSSNEARLFRTFHDQALGFDCSFAPSADGRDQRCAPSLGLPLIYTDADCTEPAAWVEQWGTRDAAQVGDAVTGVSAGPDSGREPCPGEVPVHHPAYRVAERLAEPANGMSSIPVYEVRDSRCQPASIRAKIAPAVHRLTPLSDSMFVRGQRVAIDVGDRMRLTRLLAEDGAALGLSMTGADGTPCSFQRDGECVPEPIARPQPLFDGGHVITALNGECSVGAFVSSHSRACGTPKFGVEDDGVGPLRVRAVTKPSQIFSWELTLPITEPLTYECRTHPGNDYPEVTAPGPDVTASLPTAHTLRRGSGPLYVDWFSVGQSELLPVKAAFVNEAGEACQLLPAEDGTLRCAVLDATSGLPLAELTSFPAVVDGPL